MHLLLKYSILLFSAFMLSGCLGGTIAQQIVRSIATSVADNAVGQAVDAHEKKQSAPQNTVFENTPADPYQVAVFNAAFEPATATTEVIAQPETTETETIIVKTTPLVPVELFNLLIGDEKANVYEKARLMGAISLPKQREWARWNVGTGRMQTEHGGKTITFLIPPVLGKLPSGSIAMVEIASAGELNIARYKANQLKLTK